MRKNVNILELAMSDEVSMFKRNEGDFPGGTVDKTPCSQCRGPGFDPWSRN